MPGVGLLFTVVLHSLPVLDTPISLLLKAIRNELSWSYPFLSSRNVLPNASEEPRTADPTLLGQELE